MNEAQQNYQDDEIDLRELFTTLWASKHLIFATTILFAIVGISYALLAPQVWSAKAVVVEPSTTQVEQLRLKLEQMTTTTKINNNNTDFLASFAETKLFTNFIQSFDSFDNKVAFLKTKNYLPLIDTIDKVTQQRLLVKATEGIAVTAPKKDLKPYTLSFSADTPQDAVKRLNEYLAFIQSKQETLVNKQLTDKVESQTKALTLQYQLQKTDTLKRLQEDITRTEFALRVSKAAGVEAPVENLNNQSIFMIDLGAKALDEKLKILKEIKEPEILSTALADTRLQLDSLRALPTEKVSFTPYEFLQSPEEPLSRDQPKRPLVVALATIAGLMLGIMIALFRSWWRKTAA